MGATGLEGEYITLMGDKIFKKRNPSSVILVNKSIGGSTIREWSSEGQLNSDLKSRLSALNQNYRITHIIWHQGESDFTSGTTLSEYLKSFKELKSVLNHANVTAPVFIVVSTICGYNPNWTAQNPVATA